MSDVLTPVAVERRLRDLGKELDEASAKCEAAEFNYVQAKIDFDLGSAKERLRIRDRALERGAKVTVQEIEDNALVNCATQYTNVNIAEATVKAARANVSRVKTQIDIARSVGTSVRASLEV